MKRLAAIRIAVQLAALALLASAALFGCGGGAGDPPPKRPLAGVKNLFECESFPDSTIDSISGLANGEATSTPEVSVSISLSQDLPPGCVVRVLRNGQALGQTLSECRRTCTFTETLSDDGAYEYKARTEAAAAREGVELAAGQVSGGYEITLDRVAPTQVVEITALSDDFNTSLSGKTADATPTVSGRLSAPLGRGESLRLQRTGPTESQVALLALKVEGTDWTYTEPTPLANGNYAYQGQVVDAVNKASALGVARALSVDTSAAQLQNAATLITVLNGEPAPAAGGAVRPNRITTPTLSGTIQRALNPDEEVSIYREGVRVGAAALVSDTGWSYTSAALGDGSYTFRAQVRVKEGSVLRVGESSQAISVPIDTTPPQPPRIRGFANNRPFQFNPTLPEAFSTRGTLDEQEFFDRAFVSDPDPRILFDISVAAGETVQVLRDGVLLKQFGPEAVNTTFSVSEKAQVARPPGRPTEARFAVEYRATRTDAAGNAATSRLQFSLGILPCDQRRAMAQYPLSLHSLWPPGAPALVGCTACHRSADGNFLEALAERRRETNTLGEESSYWCIKR